MTATPVGFQQGGYAVDETVQIRHVREHIVGQEDIGFLALGGQLFRQLLGKESIDAVDAALIGSAHLLFGGIDAQHRDSVVDEVAQHVTVVGRGFDDQAIGIKAAGNE